MVEAKWECTSRTEIMCSSPWQRAARSNAAANAFCAPSDPSWATRILRNITSPPPPLLALFRFSARDLTLHADQEFHGPANGVGFPANRLLPVAVLVFAKEFLQVTRELTSMPEHYVLQPTAFGSLLPAFHCLTSVPETQAVCRDLSAKVFLVRQFFQNANQSLFRVPDFQTEDATVTWRNGLTPSRPPEEQTSLWLRTRFCGSGDLHFRFGNERYTQVGDLERPHRPEVRSQMCDHEEMAGAEAAAIQKLLAKGRRHHAFVKKGKQRSLLPLAEDLTDRASPGLQGLFECAPGEGERTTHLMCFLSMFRLPFSPLHTSLQRFASIPSAGRLVRVIRHCTPWAVFSTMASSAGTSVISGWKNFSAMSVGTTALKMTTVTRTVYWVCVM